VPALRAFANGAGFADTAGVTSERENLRIAGLAVSIFALDQLTKWLILVFMNYHQQVVVVEGFFKLVLWGNTGAAYSMFHGNNTKLAIVALAALVVLFFIRRHFDVHTLPGQIALGLIFGGILGNLVDRIFRKHVVDFLYFYVMRRNGEEAGFPAFNLADTAICCGVGLLFVLSCQPERSKPAQALKAS
jgi:signal peptidase II